MQSKIKKEVILYKNKKDCCGCGACINVCPKNAIKMEEDEFGFSFPQINNDLCVQCYLCIKICSMHKSDYFNTIKHTYAAINKNEAQIMQSASGGVFAALATSILENDGIVFGCSLEKSNNKLTPKHIAISSKVNLKKLQGSKYVQSDMGYVYQEIESILKQKKIVLFSGTPCQVAALRSFLKLPYENLFTIDIICHGVPSARVFQDYVSLLEKKYKKVVCSFLFRDKTFGWGLFGRAELQDKTKNYIKKIPVKLSSFYSLFLDAEIYRDSCYDCKYAQLQRVGDITIGDYWGIEKAHPDYLVVNYGGFNEKKGISCLMINTNKGENLIKDYGIYLNLRNSDFHLVAKENGQLNTPSVPGQNRTKVLELYKNGGYKAVEKWFDKKLGYKKFLYVMWNHTPSNIKNMIKKLLK